MRDMSMGNKVGRCRGCSLSDEASVEAADSASSSSVVLACSSPGGLKLIGSERARKLRELGVLSPSTSKKVFFTVRLTGPSPTAIGILS